MPGPKVPASVDSGGKRPSSAKVPDHRHPHTHPELAPPPPPHPGPIVTLTTDIGWSYAAQMKAALLSGAPLTRIIDVTHEVPSHSILEGAFIMRYCGIHFPPGSIHVGVVDPGVGSHRQPLILQCKEGSLLVGPDNGLLMPLAQALGDPVAFKIVKDKVSTDRPIAPTFEGRDLFAPTAALLAAGEPPSSLGDPTTALAFHLPTPHLSPGAAEVTVLHVDGFGNIITNLPFDEFSGKISHPGGHAIVEESHQHYRAVVARTYSELEEGCLGIVGSSFGLTELTVNKGRADRVLVARTGTRLQLRLSDRDWKE
jgi:S-adenosyl-L-methionine hydrolase (adenosine-forming)